MHGLLFAELKAYAVARLGPPAWNTLLEKARLPGRVYMANQAYPDAELGSIVAAAAQTTGKDAQAILEDFGKFIAPDLLKLYGSHVNPNWKLLDFLEHTEETIHRLVRLRDPRAAPPRLRTQRLGPDRLLLIYDSERRLCAVARGIIVGLADHYGEPVSVEDEKCMLRGDPRCEIRVQVRGPTKGAT